MTRRRCICGHELGRHTWNRARCLDRDCGCVVYRPDNRPAFTEHEMVRCADCEHRRIEHRPICLATTKYAQNCDCLVFVEKATPIPAAPEGTTYAEMMAWPEMQALARAIDVGAHVCWCGHPLVDHSDLDTRACLIGKYDAPPTFGGVPRCPCERYELADSADDLIENLCDVAALMVQAPSCRHLTDDVADLVRRARRWLDTQPKPEPYQGMTDDEFERLAASDHARFGPGRAPESGPIDRP